MNSTPPLDILAQARGLLQDGAICDRCLGRQFGWLSTSTSNPDRGGSLKLVLSMTADHDIRSGDSDRGRELIAVLAGNGMFLPAQKLAEKYEIEYTIHGSCRLCTIDGESVFSRIERIAERAAELLREIEFDTFLAGCRPDPRLSDREDEVRAKHSLLHGETLKSDFNRELGKQLRTVLKKEVDFERPEIVVIYDMVADSIDLQISPVFIYGRYRKLQRGIPQSRWDCKNCGGKGCEKCNWTGRRYPDSIAEYIGEPILEVMQGRQYKFHAAGREDIDVLMLGNGRPFVIEISEPRIRRPDLDKLADLVNERAKGKVEIFDLEFATRELSQTLQSESSTNVKEYQALIQVEGDVNEEQLRSAEEKLRGTVVQQRTPTRVIHRRADKVRPKRVYEVTLKRRDDGLVEGHFRVQGGTYIKELISGDNGRTEPSIASLLGTPAKCVQLNVTGIMDVETDHNA